MTANPRQSDRPVQYTLYVLLESLFYMNIIDIDIDIFRVKPEDSILPSGISPSLPITGKPSKKWFLKGPIPGEWLSQAASLPGRALHTALVLWHVSALGKTRTVAPPKSKWELFGVTESSRIRGLRALEQAGLVSVERHPGRCPRVTIIVRRQTLPKPAQDQE